MKVTPQNIKVPGTKKNSAGGYSFAIDKWQLLDRFLVLGTEGGTYYISEQKLTKQNAENVLKCIKEDGIRAVNRIVEISEAGRAPKNDPALFALALATAYGNDETKAYAYQAVPRVARTGTHLFHFAEFRKLVGGWGSGMKRAVAGWYTNKSVDQLGYQVIKYRQRDGWTHKDLLRLAHPYPQTEQQNALFAWITHDHVSENLPRIVEGFLKVQSADSEKAVAGLIDEYALPWEAVPTKYLNSKKVWESLLYAGQHGMPLTAMIRNLNKMTAIGLLAPMSEASMFVTERLLNDTAIAKSRIHPLQVMNAMFAYKTGGKPRGYYGYYNRQPKINFTWKPLPAIVDALDETFYISFGNVEPTKKRLLLALDISGSMGISFINNMSLNAREASAAMAMVTARTENPAYYRIVGFSRSLIGLDITPRQRLDTVIKNISGLPFGGTDCAQPMEYALKKGMPVDAFIVYTDSETWAGRIHPFQALEQYRKHMGINAKLIVVGMTANRFSIANPKDPGMLDVVGFDTATPSVMSDFIREF